MAMSAGHSPRSEATKSTGPVATLPASETTRTKKSTPYNRDFDLHLSDHSIYPEYSSQEPDLEAIMAALAMPRLSLAPIHFTKDEFKAFRMADARTKDEDDVTANVLPTILGAHDPSQVSARNTVFRNIAPLTDGTIVAAAPDIYYGAHPEELCRPVRNALSAHIIPSTMQDKPLAPNFFVEVKGPNGTAAVATRQARYDGAVGARAMHSLQNYGEKELKYDNQVYTYSSIYHGGFGTLKLFAHHVTASANKGGQPEYHMTHVDTWALTGNVDSFRRGVTAFRNARDLAKQHRDRFIRAANALSKTIVPQNTETHQEAIDQGATDCPGPQDSKEPEPTANDNGHNDGHGNGHDNEHGNGHRIQDGTQTTASSQKPPRDPKELSQDSAAPTPSPAPSLTSAKTKPRLQTAEPVSPAVPDAPVEEDAAPQRPKTGRAAGQGKPGRARPKGTLRKEAGERDVPYGG
ncbi:hypothetical protein SCUCBS95973_007010 [Sporothrix curviconia]|uniref:DUF7924 domain-containing protein n=1 Tax=Sporothrix curviconia TaxID=1260050 RepID=A0ABP0CB26_9PEZI